MKFVLGAIAAAVLAGAAFVQPAEARCFWNGVAMECYGHSFYRPWRHHYWNNWDNGPHYRVYRDWY